MSRPTANAEPATAGVAIGNGAVLNDTGSDVYPFSVCVTDSGGATLTGIDTLNAPVVPSAAAVHVAPFESDTDTDAPALAIPVNT